MAPKKSQKKEGARRGRGLRELAACDLKLVHPSRLDSSLLQPYKSQFEGVEVGLPQIMHAQVFGKLYSPTIHEFSPELSRPLYPLTGLRLGQSNPVTEAILAWQEHPERQSDLVIQNAPATQL